MHHQPLYQNTCCSPKGLLTFIIASYGLALTLEVSSFCLTHFVPQHFHCFHIEQPPGASVEHNHSKVTAGLIGQSNPFPKDCRISVPLWHFCESECENTVLEKSLASLSSDCDLEQISGGFGGPSAQLHCLCGWEIHAGYQRPSGCCRKC